MENNYIVSARKYRPSTFRSVVGQEALTHTLKTAIATGRLAHAYLFCGPRGVGKTTCARIFAKTINCMNPGADGEACNECASCRAFNEQQSFNITELDAASNNSVDDIRNITEQVRIPPQTGRYRVFIIDEVHMLSQAAFNAFLKTLEEPPEYAIFILATTEKQKVIPTILSRCQIYDFARITVPDIVRQLQYICQEEHVTAEPAALNVIAQKADGAMRDALSIFDQVVASSQGNVTYQAAIDNLNVLDYDYYFRLVDTFTAGDVPQSLLIYKEVRDKGFDSQFFVNGLAQHLRDLMVASTPQTRVLLEMNDDVSQRYVAQAQQLGAAFLYRAIELCNTCDLNYRASSNKQLLVELTLIKLCQLLDPARDLEPRPQGLKPIAAVKPSAAPAQPHPQPQPQSSAAPAQPQVVPSAPAPAQPQVARPVRQASPVRMATSSTRIMINRPAAAVAPEGSNEKVVSASEVKREPFTQEQLLVAWNDYIAANPHEQVLVNTMRMSEPQRVNDTLYRITVENQAQVEFFEASKGKLMEFLHNNLRNDMLAIEVVISDTTSEHRIWTPREVVEDLRERLGEPFNNFIKEFGLNLA